MSDFFTRVVLHAGRGLGVVRPRPVALFEEVGLREPARKSEEVEGLQHRAPPTDSGPGRSHAAPHDGTRRSQEPASSTVRTTVGQRAAKEPDRPHPSVGMPRASHERPSRTPEQRAHLDDPGSEASHVQGPGSRDADSRQPVIERHVFERRVEVTRVQPAGDAGTKPLAPLRPTPVEPQRATAVLPSSLQQARFVRPADSVAAPDARGRRTPGTPEERPPDRGVTVEVTIGRVDVRAVMPAGPQPREPRARTPELSLDEYLRQRGRGRA